MQSLSTGVIALSPDCLAVGANRATSGRIVAALGRRTQLSKVNPGLTPSHCRHYYRPKNGRLMKNARQIAIRRGVQTALLLLLICNILGESARNGAKAVDKLKRSVKFDYLQTVT